MPPLPLPADGWGQVPPRARLSASPRARVYTAPGVLSVFYRLGLKRDLKLISRNSLKASKIYILRFMAPKIVKQILVDFLGVDLWFKNIACWICDTFLWSFI
jgi:hypothetical protein